MMFAFLVTQITRYWIHFHDTYNYMREILYREALFKVQKDLQ